MSLSIADYQGAADKLGVDIASVRSVASVESSGKGFFTTDNSPVILFERHIFYKELLTKRNAEAKNRVLLENPTTVGDALAALTANAIRAVKNEVDKIMVNNPTICNTATGGYLGGYKEVSRLQAAKKIDEEAALRSCSWGAFQVMGFHAEFLGFKDVFEFVQHASTDAGQLDIFTRFIQKNPSLLKALKAKNWALFAQLYNGPAFAKNQYDTKLASAFNRFTANPTLA